MIYAAREDDTNLPQCICFLVFTTKLSDLIFEKEWYFLPTEVVSARQDFANDGMAYLDTIHSLLFCVRKPGEGFIEKYGISVCIDSPDQSARTRSNQLTVVGGFILRWSMAYSRYDLATLPELNSGVEYDITVLDANLPPMPI